MRLKVQKKVHIMHLKINKKIHSGVDSSLKSGAYLISYNAPRPDPDLGLWPRWSPLDRSLLIGVERSYRLIHPPSLISSLINSLDNH